MIDLKQIITKYPECLESAEKLKAYLVDLYPEEKARCSILATIFDVGIIEQIKRGKVDNLSVDRYCNSLEDTYGYSPRLIRECVSIWSSVYESKISSAIIKEKEQPLETLPFNSNDFDIINGVLVECKGEDKEIEIPDCVIEIGDNAFSGSELLRSIDIPDSVIAIGDEAFLNCKSLANIVVPESVATIGESSFRGCESLKSIQILNDKVLIGESAFCGCNSLTISCHDGSSTERYAKDNDIHFWTFSNVSDFVIQEKVLEEYRGNANFVIIPWLAIKIEDYAFLGNTSIIIVNIPNGVETIGKSAFSHCKSLFSIEIPESVTEIGMYAFSECTALEKVVLPNKLTRVGFNLFRNCISLRSIVIPDSVTVIEHDAFLGCHSYVIECNHGSYAEQYATENGIDIEYLD